MRIRLVMMEDLYIVLKLSNLEQAWLMDCDERWVHRVDA